MKTKTFDCVEMKHKSGRRIYERLKGKTVEEQIDFWRKIEEKHRERRKETLSSSDDRSAA